MRIDCPKILGGCTVHRTVIGDGCARQGYGTGPASSATAKKDYVAAWSTSKPNQNSPEKTHNDHGTAQNGNEKAHIATGTLRNGSITAQNGSKTVLKQGEMFLEQLETC